MKSFKEWLTQDNSCIVESMSMQGHVDMLSESMDMTELLKVYPLKVEQAQLIVDAGVDGLDPKKLGRFDKQQRFYLEDAYQTLTSIVIRPPSAAWPYSVYKHAFTSKYKKALLAKANTVLGLN